MLFSIIIPTYNRKNLLIRSLKSILSQSYFSISSSSPGEVVVVDDGSIESEQVTLNEIHKIFIHEKDLGFTIESISLGIKTKSIHYNSIIVIHNESELEITIYLLLKRNGGVSSARNYGSNFAKGEWLFFLDSDDEWKKDKLKDQLEFIRNNPDILIHQTKEIWIRNGKFVNTSDNYMKVEGNLFEKSLDRCMITPSSVSIHRDLWKNMGGMDEDFPACEDYDLWIGITSNHLVGLLDKFHLTRYSGHANQLSNTHPIMDRFRIYSLLKRGIEFNENCRELAKKVLIRKLDILIQGRNKRKKDSKVLQEIQNWVETSYGNCDPRIYDEWKKLLFNQNLWVE